MCTLYNYEFNGELLFSSNAESYKLCQEFCEIPDRRPTMEKEELPIGLPILQNINPFGPCNLFTYNVTNGTCSLITSVTGFRFNPNFISGSSSEC